MNAPPGTLGIVGLGLLGTAAAERLRSNDRVLVGFDVDPDRRSEFERAGGTVLESGSDVLAESDVTLLCLPTSATVLALLDSANDLSRCGTLVDATTGDPDDVAAIGRWVEARGGEYVEAKVAGSSEQLRRGEATLFVAGTESGTEGANPVLAALGESRFVLGPAGAAARFKLVHNLVLGLHRAVLAEGLAFAESLGFDAGRTLEVLRETPAASPVMHTKGPAMVARDYPPRATLAQHLKDVRLMLAAAAGTNARLPLTETHRDLLEAAVDAGYGASDNAAVFEAYRT